MLKKEIKLNKNDFYQLSKNKNSKNNSERDKSFVRENFNWHRNNLFDLKIIKKIDTTNDNLKEMVNTIENSLNRNKYSVIISSKTFKKAVERNKIKRIIYNIIKEYLKENPNSREYSYDLFCLFYPKKEILNENYNYIKNNIYDIIKSIN